MTSTRLDRPDNHRVRLAAVALLAMACAPTPLAPPDLPAGAVPLEAPAVFRSWWDKTEACSGLSGKFEDIAWYTVPAAHTIETSLGPKVGLWTRHGGAVMITLAGEYSATELVVRHEMLHELLGRGGHPADYFVNRCHLTWSSWHQDAG